uniref:NECAP PHear domain-containing protein n=1 Tax=Neobodo designis TaxID=312471 RepID=A0A7S1QP52_NEODS|mmetsp:Transcript_49656/g.153376  ORF Transcript_49656/g.153376 Transcript_49656/m.153376 type:complete len:283 (+) Transcript_49656:35-883(+)|eukprot:CAMPEP_0174876044 /NCGR_PEP_ID=MMETSP1114-20130205/79374_1 /TAXON_ID=312471 /ORGANISM="Neobodo designis, Strain CCAP 1951/1" /LENGTH=282 /DNA_ID=CAMNT_0016111401 /DNA_START=30 /DNA_END=878 /DNA_ORIENTATION=+
MEGIALFETETCHVFRVASGDSLKSEAWEGCHIWTGSVRVFQDRIELFDDSAVFGVCPLRDDPDAPIPVKPTTDSRRCFVVRVEQGDRYAYLGINFETHNIAFMFHTAVLERHRTSGSREVETVEVHDRRLGPGQTFSVDLVGKIKSSKDASGGTVAQKVEDYNAPAPAAPAAISLTSGPGARTGASRRISSRAPAAGAAAPPAAPTQQQPAQHSSPPLQTATTTLASTSSTATAASAKAPDPFDPFADVVPVSSGSNQQPPPQAGAPPPAKPVDPLDALFA